MLGLLKICTAARAASLDLLTSSVFIDPMRLFLGGWSQAPSATVDGF